jgi:signal transduction histidine kinase
MNYYISKHFFKKVIYRVILLCSSLTLFLFPKIAISQVDLSSLSPDSLNVIVSEIMYNHPDSGQMIAHIALEKSQKQKNTLQEAIAFKNLGLISFYTGDNTDAERLLLRSVDLIKKTANKNLLGDIYLILGGITAQQNKYVQATTFMLNAIELYEKVKDYRGIKAIYNNLGLMNYRIRNFQKSIFYIKKSIGVNALYKTNYNNLIPFSTLALVYQNIGKPDSALIIYKRVYALTIKEGDKRDILLSTNDIAGIFNQLGQSDSAIYFYNKAKKLAIELNDKNMIAVSEVNLGRVDYKKNALAEALRHAKKGLGMSKKYEYLELQRDAYSLLKDIYNKKAEYKKALHALENLTLIKDSITSNEIQNKIIELESKYESEKKDQKIDLLSKENQINKLEVEKKNNNLRVTILLAILAVFIILFTFLYIRKKQKMKQIIDLQKSQDKLLKMERKVLSSIIETEDKERKRFAEDIHDEVNPLLSSIKLYLGELKYTEGEEKNQMLDIANELTTEAIKQVREISHNIMPVVLNKKGLLVSLQDFFEKIRYSKKLNIILNENIGNKRFLQNIELIIFRTIKELINNTIKHSKATKVTISFNKKNDVVHIYYVDNGIGFNIEEQKSNQEKGIGLTNIINRINSINGSCSIKSKEGEGVRIGIQIKL